MKLLDLYCGAGGASMGYHRAGFEVIGVDITPQPNYPFELILADVFDLEESFFDEFDVIHASPPCQAYSKASAQWRNKGVDYPDLISATRALLDTNPYIIENVPMAPLFQPLTLCGTMFGLRVIRHRLFEINADAWIYPPCDCRHNGYIYNGDYVNVTTWGAICRPPLRSKEWRKRKSDAYFAKIKKKYNVSSSGRAQYLDWCAAIGIDWMNKQTTLTKNKYDLSQAIPPAYTHHIGKLILEGMKCQV